MKVRCKLFGHRMTIRQSTVREVKFGKEYNEVCVRCGHEEGPFFTGDESPFYMYI